MKRLLAASFIFVLTIASAQTTVTTNSARTGIGGVSVTSVSVTTANGVSGSVANPTTTPAISLTLGAITPTSVTTSTINGTPTMAATNLTGTASGLTAGTVTTNANLTGDVTSTGNAATVVKINGTSLSGLATGILKNTTTTGVPSIAIAADFPTLNQSTTGSAATLTTPRAIAGHNFDGSAAITIACGDLSNGATGCSTATGTSGATIPLLNGTNTWSGANTFTRLQTVTQGTANEGVLASTGYSLTGSSAISMFDLAGTLNTSGSPDVFALRVTDTARGATTKFFNIYGGASGTTSVFTIDRSGSSRVVGDCSAAAPCFQVGGGTNTGMYSAAGPLAFSVGGTSALQVQTSQLLVPSGGGYVWNSAALGGGGPDTGLTRPLAGVVQFNGGTAATTKGAYQIIDDTTGSSHTSTSSTELTTLNTGATTTATSGNLAAANSQIKAILLRVTTTITTAANFTVKVTGGNAFCQIGTATTSNSTLTANTTYVMVPCAHADAYVSAATTLTYTLNANPGAGVIRATVVYETFTPPSS